MNKKLKKAQDNYFLLSLGCSKNTVDSESMAQLMERAGIGGVGHPDDAQFLIVNTCGFIGPAKQESIDELRRLGENKRDDQYLIAAGCLTQRYGGEVLKQVPQVDGLLGTRRWMDIVKLAGQLRDKKHPDPIYHLPEVATVGKDEKGAMRTAIQGTSAYLKIADGCRRPCAFCAIPLIKGTAVSRPIEAVVAEAQRLETMGIKELLLIAQDSTDYGYDLGMKDGLAQLLEQLCENTSQIPWMRIMYAYPGYVTERLMDTIAKYPQVLPYLDMPLQHANRQTLKRMKRPANIDWVYRTVESLRNRVPELAIRSTFIVGYPGETDKEFEDLVQFIKDLRFDRVGAFTFSFEPGTTSEPLGDDVPEHVKEERRNYLMEVQQQISLEKNQELVGKTMDIMVDGNGDGMSVGRTYRDAPEIDGMVIVEGELPVGEIVPVRITGAMPYDLTATVDIEGPQIIGDGLLQL